MTSKQKDDKLNCEPHVINRMTRPVDAEQDRREPCACGMDARASSEDGLEREYDKFFQAVEASPSSVVITDRDGVIEYVNDRFITSTGYTREQAIGRKPNLLKSGQTAPEVYEDLWATISAGKIWRGEMCNRKRTGEHYWEATAIAPIFDADGDITHFVAVKEDITERRNAQEELRATRDRATRAEQNLADAIESMPEGFVLYDQNGKLIICNSRFRDDYGYTEAQTAPGVHFTDLGRIDVQSGNVVVPDGYKDADTYLQTKLEYRIKLEGTFPVVLKDGRHLMTRDRRTSSGGLVSVQTDITKIKQTEEALRTSERKFWSVFHASPSLMTISLEKDGRFIDVNAKWVEVMGYDYSEAVGKTAEELMVWSSPVMREGMLSNFNADGVLSNFETRLKTRNGKMRDLLISGVRMIVDGEEALLLVYHDITERKSIELALKRSEQEVRTILDNIVEAFYRTDNQGKITRCSAGIENLLGYVPEELIGIAARDLYVNPNARDVFLQALQDNGGRVRDFEVQLKRKDGAKIWAASSGHFIYDRDDNVIGLEGTTRDITRRKKTEQALLLAKEQAEQASAAKTQFLSGMSHELRTPLNAVIGFAQMMELQGEAPLSDKQKEYLGIIRNSGEHLLSLINEILDLARVEAGRMDMRLDPVDATAVIEECMSLVRPLALKKSVRFRFETADDNHPLIQTDRVKFKQVLLNLVCNAVKYNVEGGQVTIDVKATQSDTLRIDVTDTGQGMGAEDCAALFEPFQRLGAESSDIEGTGLGLALAKRMIDAMGGDIHVTSAPGLGTTFTLKVPLADA